MHCAPPNIETCLRACNRVNGNAAIDARGERNRKMLRSTAVSHVVLDTL